jgi:hypothetical protein
MNQIEWVSTQLKKGAVITPMDAMKGCKTIRLASHINVLRERGMNIITHTKIANNGSRYAAYQLLKGKKK